MRVQIPFRRRRGRPQLLALLPFRDEMRFLPGLFENLAGQVDGVIALADRSADGSREFVEAQPLLVELVSAPEGGWGWLREDLRQRKLIEAAWEHGADWLLAIDADERLEREFRSRAEPELRRAARDGHAALWVSWCELWDAPDTMRVDGIWGEKRKPSLFTSDRGHRFHDRRMHSFWAPWPPANGEYPTADLRIYHLRMIELADREARADRYRELDPDREWHAIGYDYRVDEEGLELAPIEPGREYVPLGAPPPA